MLTSRLGAGGRGVFQRVARARVQAAGAAATRSYLDYAGSALYAESHIRAHAALLATGLFGNPHSEHAASRASADATTAAKRRLLSFLDADPDVYVMCFTANTSAAIKLVAESYPFGPEAVCILTADNHNSVNGIREYARRAGSAVSYLPLDAELRSARAGTPAGAITPAGAPGLFGVPCAVEFFWRSASALARRDSAGARSRRSARRRVVRADTRPQSAHVPRRFRRAVLLQTLRISNRARRARRAPLGSRAPDPAVVCRRYGPVRIGPTRPSSTARCRRRLRGRHTALPRHHRARVRLPAAR